MKTFLPLLSLLLLAQPVLAAAKTPVVVELYTSQSCSSCPKADALLVELAQNPDLITFGCHVTYWDHLQWKDTFSLNECTQRQKDFGERLEDGRVYTPEAIVNGQATMVGYREDLINAAVKKQVTDAKSIPLSIVRKDKDFLVTFPKLIPNKKTPYIATLIAYGDAVTVKIGSGENSGSSVTYAKPVIFMKELEYWQGTDTAKIIGGNLIPEKSKGLVLTVQAEKGAPILAAGELKLN